MRLDIGEMHSGADRSYGAAWLASEGADALATARVTSGAFGAFGSAESFREAIGTAHDHHIRRLRAEQDRLGALGDTAHTTASAFTEMERRNSEAMRAVLWPDTRA